MALVLQAVRLLQPVGDRRLDLVPVSNPDQVVVLGLGARVRAHDGGGLERPAQEHADFEELQPGPHEEVAGLARKHDRMMRGVDALVAELDRRVPQSLPRVAQVFGQVLRQRRFGGRPAVVLFVGFNPLLAVKTLARRHRVILSSAFHARPDARARRSSARTGQASTRTHRSTLGIIWTIERTTSIRPFVAI